MFPAAFLEGAHAIFDSDLTHFFGGGLFDDHFVNLIVDDENFVDADSSAVAEAVTFFAADAFADEVGELSFGRIDFKSF